jgi:hypothetical protein
MPPTTLGRSESHLSYAAVNGSQWITGSRWPGAAKWWSRVMQSYNIPVCLVLVAALSAPSCMKMPDENAVDPPELNQRRLEPVRLYVTAPPTLSVRFAATYRIGTWLGLAGGGGRYCGSKEERNPGPNSVSTPLPSVDVPLELKWDAQRYVGAFFIDQFSPGRCHWGFDDLTLTSPARTGLALYSDYTVNYNFDTSHSRGIYDQSPDQNTDIWCGADPSPHQGETGKTICTALDYFEEYAGIVSPELRALVPAEQNIPMVHIFPFTKSITLRIHDLDAENRAALSAGSTASAARQYRAQ